MVTDLVVAHKMKTVSYNVSNIYQINELNTDNQALSSIKAQEKMIAVVMLVLQY